MKLNLKKINAGKIVVIGIVILGLIVVVSSLWGNLMSKAGILQQPVIITVEKGASLGGIANQLAKNGVIEDTKTAKYIFKLSSYIMLAEDKLQAGTYNFEPKISVRKVIKMLYRGEVAQYSITIPEGLTTAEILQKIVQEKNLTGDLNLSKISVGEGALLPETYQYSYGENRLAVVTRMQKAMQEALAMAWELATIEQDAGKENSRYPIKSPQELLTLASIVEKETSLASERAEIAGVFVNRLRKRMRLQTDPTVIYGASNYHGNLTRAHLMEDHPYNTYRRRGLPPGAICNPGKDALLAAANPAETDSIYFVATGNGGHKFATTNKDHQKNVQDYLKVYREKNGK